MDATRQFICNAGRHEEDLFNPLITATTQMGSMLFISHVFYLLLKPLGQSGPIAQILAGVTLSPSLLSHISHVKEFFLQTSSAGYYSFFTFIFRTAFMFLIGLELDTRFLRRNLRTASAIAYGGTLMCTIFGAVLAWLMIRLLEIQHDVLNFVLVFLMIISNTASPLVVRVIADMKLATSNIGRLAISSSLVVEMSWASLTTLFSSFTSPDRFKAFFLLCLFTLAIVVVNRFFLAPWVSSWNNKDKYLTKPQVFFFLLPILILSTVAEYNGFSSTLPCFLLGFAFPREGKAARTLLHLLSYPVHEFILPIYYGYIGFQFNIGSLKKFRDFLVLIITVVFSFGGKVIGILAICYYLKFPRHQGVFLSFMLNMKSNAGFLLADASLGFRTLWSPEARDLFTLSIVIDTLISGTLACYLLRKEQKYYAHYQSALEFHTIESELRMLACVYTSHHASGAVGLISALSGSLAAPIAPQLTHLVELRKKHKARLMYHQLEDGEEFSDEENYGADDVVEINYVVDTFTKGNKTLIRQSKIVSPLSNLHEDVCNCAEDLRVSIIILPFHKHQRIDGRLENGNQGIRTINQKVLRHAPCSVGILVDRGQTGFQPPHLTQMVQHVATLFFGGPDDREALALSKWFIMHPQVNLTVIRFLPAPVGIQNQMGDASGKSNDILMSITTHETEDERDNSFLGDFYKRYVASGEVGYIEKYVECGAQTVAILRDIGEMYSLFVVGKGRKESPMTTGMSDWEECPELGTVGDLLAASDLQINASVLVVQKHKHLDRNPVDD